VEGRLYLKLRSLASPVYFEAHARVELTVWNFFQTNIDLRVLGRVVVTLFSSDNNMVLLRAVTLHRLHQLRRGCLNDLHYSNILLPTFIYHFKMNVSECADLRSRSLESYCLRKIVRCVTFCLHLTQGTWIYILVRACVEVIWATALGWSPL